MKNKKIVSLLLAACLSIGAMSVNVWAENGNEQKEETPAPVVQEVEGEKPDETKPDETKPDETKPDETKPEETPVATPEAAATYGTVETASERGLELHKTYTIQMVDKDGKPIKDTTFTLHLPGGLKIDTLTTDAGGFLTLKVWKPITTADNDFYLKAPDGTWYWVELEIGGSGYDLYRHPDDSQLPPWLTERDKFEEVTLEPEKPEPPTPPTPEEPELGKKTFAVYYRYDNETPSPQHSPRDDEEYGPSGDSKSNFTLTVDMDKLKEKHPNGIKYDANDRVTEWYITPDSCSTDAKTWWENVLACATEKDNLPEKFQGYCLKQIENDDVNPCHCDGILTVNLPYYMVELYYGDDIVGTVGGSTGSTPNEQNIIDKYQAVKSITELSFETNTFKYGETTYEFTLTKDPKNGTIENNGIFYMPTKTPNFYLALYTISEVKEVKPTPDPEPTGTFTITKVDAANHDLKLEGAEFTLSQNGDTIGGPRTTGTDGKVTFDNLEKDTYILKETKAPQGYVKPSEYYTVVVGEDGTISVRKFTAPSGGDFTVTLPDDFIIQNPDENVVVKDKNFVVENTKEAPGTTSYTFMKHGVVTTVDSNGRTIRTTESPLAGAEFTLYDAEENMLQTVRSAVDGSVTFSNLKEGGYVIRETKAPAGYTGWNGKIYLSVRNNEENKLEAVADLGNHTGVKWDGNKLTVLNYTTVKETDRPVDDRPSRPTYRDDDDDDFVLPTVTRKDNNKKPANKPERAPKVEEVVPSKRNPETGNSSSMPIAMAAAAVSLTGLVVLCKKKDK